jgi:hypothetical protein
MLFLPYLSWVSGDPKERLPKGVKEEWRFQVE